MLASKEYYDYYYSRPTNTRLKKPIYNPKLQLGLIKGIFQMKLLAEQSNLEDTEEIEEKNEFDFSIIIERKVI